MRRKTLKNKRSGYDLVDGAWTTVSDHGASTESLEATEADLEIHEKEKRMKRNSRRH